MVLCTMGMTLMGLGSTMGMGSTLGKGSTMGMESIMGMDQTVGMGSTVGYMVMISEVDQKEKRLLRKMNEKEKK